MQRKKTWRISWMLSLAVLILMVAVSLACLSFPILYRDNAFIRAVWRGNDLVSLGAAVPVFILGLISSRRGSLVGELIRLGLLDYTLYNYAFYLLAARYNVLFLPYVLVIVLSAFGLLTGLLSSRAKEIKEYFRTRLPGRWIAGYLLFVAGGLSAVYCSQCMGFIFQGTIPDIIPRSGHVTHIVPALDLTLLVPWLVLGGLWLWQRRPWGYVVTVVITVKSVLYTLVLAAASLSAVQAGFPEAMGEVPLWLTIWVGFIITSVLLLANYRSAPKPTGEII
mgnify:CR=1 FL=1